MNCTRCVISAALASVALLTAGCGITGATRRIVLDASARGDAMSTRKMELTGVTLEPEATKLLAIAVFPWGELSAQDVQTLDLSLRDNLRLSQVPGNLKEPSLLIDVRIRRHLVATSNNAGAALACVAWRARLSGVMIYEEQFYASASGRLIGTVGSVKNSVNKGIVERIVRSAILIANNASVPSILPLQVKGTYLVFDDSIKGLPKAMTSLPPPGYVYVPGNPSSKVPWSWAEPTEAVRWEQQ